MLDGVTLTIIVASAAAVLMASFPVIARALVPDPPAAARRGIERALRARGWAAGPATLKDHRYAPPVSDIPRGSLLEELDRARSASPFHNAEGRAAQARGRLMLLDRGDPNGEPVLSVDEHDTLVVVRDIGAWLLLATHRGGRVQLGWVQRHQVAIIR